MKLNFTSLSSCINYSLLLKKTIFSMERSLNQYQDCWNGHTCVQGDTGIQENRNCQKFKIRCSFQDVQATFGKNHLACRLPLKSAFWFTLLNYSTSVHSFRQNDSANMFLGLPDIAKEKIFIKLQLVSIVLLRQ